MTWGYWGIVAGLLVLLGIFFACMEIMYTRARNGGSDRHGGMDSAHDAEKSRKHAA